MQKEVEYKYPNSAKLFRFCRKVLDHKFGGIRVIDQDVGQILGFDPADCSHWKKGKKNIRSIQAMQSIANHLGVDEKIVVDLATGEISEIEAYFEFSGYGSSLVDTKFLDSAKKEFYRKHANSWSVEKEVSFKKFFQIDKEKILSKVNEIHNKVNFEEAPLYLPEVVSHYTSLILSHQNQAHPPEEGNLVESHWDDNKFVIKYKAGYELKPFMRFSIAKKMAIYFLGSQPLESQELKPFSEHIRDIESNIFASYLLVPSTLLKSELSKLNPEKDLIAQLADIFWVSKAFIGNRLKEIILEQ